MRNHFIEKNNVQKKPAHKSQPLNLPHNRKFGNYGQENRFSQLCPNFVQNYQRPINNGYSNQFNTSSNPSTYRPTNESSNNSRSTHESFNRSFTTRTNQVPHHRAEINYHGDLNPENSESVLGLPDGIQMEDMSSFSMFCPPVLPCLL